MTGQFGENAIEFLNGDDKATVSFNKLRYIKKIKKLASSRPEEVEIVAENEDGSICAHIPVDWVKIIPKRVVSDELKEEARKRMSELRNGNSGKGVNLSQIAKGA
jgi:hypothetical protein